ncbi:MAG: putative HTH-type transcriptional regulator [Methanoregulaceae archaeon PtaU1.Bin059]|nr:MAG: putative HTH-type transcriptional regulator [Methanoregulaceae archaeon PtaB.Bin152]OPY41098.1 MAG: putative HTH-type transcriptional regulator [Methanoregulaceae archaeon PtaU1.Bin059]
MDPCDVRILAALEEGLPFVREPFEEVGVQVGMTGSEVIARIRALCDEGIIRKFRARINQRRVGITANALVAWRPGESPNGDVRALLASFPCVTHCYERRPVPGRWEYTLYTVHHGYSREEVRKEVEALAGLTGIRDYVVIFSTEEFKRVPNVRIRENGGIKP